MKAEGDLYPFFLNISNFPQWRYKGNDLPAQVGQGAIASKAKPA